MASCTLVGLLIIVTVLIVGCQSVPKPSGSTYTTKYDNIDLQEILKSERLLKNYVNCLLDNGRCTTDGRELKSHIADAIRNDCAKCTEKQKQGGEKVMRYLHDNKPEMYQALINKYDPTGEYRVKYEKRFKH